MFTAFDLKFANTIGVLYDLKQLKKHKTMQETYKLLESTEFDDMLVILTVAYNRANKTSISEGAFLDLLEEKQLGFLAIAEIYQSFVEGIMFGGLTPEQVDAKKKSLNLPK